MVDAMLTTKDNPYNPFTQYEQWLSFDELSGYHTQGYISRIANTSNELTDDENDLLIDIAMQEIVAYEPDIYEIVTKETED